MPKTEEQSRKRKKTELEKRIEELEAMVNTQYAGIQLLEKQRGGLCNFFRYYFESHTITLSCIDGLDDQILNCSFEGRSDDDIAGLADNLYCIMLNTSNILGMLY